MKQRSILLVILVLFLTITATAPQSLALGVPSVSGDYKLKACSPSDDPSTGQIEVRPGQEITVEATATITYKGMTFMSPPIDITTVLHLMNGSVAVASETQSTRVDSMLLEDGKTYTKTGSGKLTVPSSVKPGLYKLNCNANAQASMLGKGMSKSASQSFTVKVLKNPVQSPGNLYLVSPTPEPFTYYSLKRFIRQM